MSCHRITGTLRRGAITTALVLVGTAALASGAQAAKIGFNGNPGTHRPPAKLGGYLMKKFGPDSQPVGAVTFVQGPTGKVRFNEPLNHQTVHTGWSNWGNGYMGDVYFINSPSSVTLTLPRRTKAFYFYAMTDNCGPWTITANSGHKSSGPVTVTNTCDDSVGPSAKYFGFYAKKPGVRITSITVTASPDTPGIAVGEFGIAR
jgi:hypothetical protein